MAQVDLAGAVCATRRANGYVSSRLRSIPFYSSIRYSSATCLSIYADIVKVGRYVDYRECRANVYAERNRLDVEIVKATEATLTYVATGEVRRPRPVPAIETIVDPRNSDAV